MARSIDERVVSAAFENEKFEKNVAVTLKTLEKLNTAIASLGKTSGLKNLETEASKITLKGPVKALETLKSKFVFGEAKTAFAGVEAEANKIKLKGPIAALQDLKSKMRFPEASDAFRLIEKASTVVFLRGPMKAFELLKKQMTFENAARAFHGLEMAANVVTFGGLQRAIGKIQGAFRFPGAQQAFSDIERGADKITLGGITRAVGQATKQFSILESAASVALGNIATKAITKGGAMAKGFTLGPLIQGFEEYSTNLNSIQTILANTRVSGADLRDVNKALEELNHYSDQTIYNFSQMAESIGLFTAAGVDLKTSTASIKGIANLAALSGSNSEKATHAMQQLAQAISSGRVSLQDWNSVVTAGMGGTTLQRALALTGEKMGKLKGRAVELSGAMKNVKIDGESFRESIQATPGRPSWLTSDVLTATLQQFTGDLTDAELAAQGFSKAEIKSIQDMAKTAKKAATEVKTIKGATDVIKESIGSGWAKTFQIIFGDFDEAKTLFTNFTTYITDLVGKNADARNKILADWKKLGGRKELIEGIKSGWEGILTVIKPIKDAFREIFPAKTGEDLMELTKRFKDFMDTFRLGPEGAGKLQRIFEGLFAALHIGVSVVKEVVHFIGKLFDSVSNSSGGFTEFLASVGDFVQALDDALTKGGALRTWFDSLAGVLEIPMKILVAMAKAIASLFDGSDSRASSVFMDALGEIGNKMGPIQKTLDLFADGWRALVTVFNDLAEAVEPGLQDVVTQIGAFSDKVAEAFEKDVGWDKVFDVLETTFIGGMFIAVKKALSNGLGINFGDDLLKNVGNTLEVVTANLQTMQQNVKANTILQVAAALFLLAGSVKKISEIDSSSLGKAMTAIAVGLGELVAAVALLAFIGGGWKAALGLGPIAGGMIAIATATLILSHAMENFGEMEWEEIAKGILGVFGALVAVGTGMQAVNPKGLMRVAITLIPIGLGLMVISTAVRMMADLKWEELAKGILGMLFALAALGDGLAFVGPIALATGPGLILVSFAMSMLAGAIGTFGSMDLKTLVKGILGMGIAMSVLGGAMYAFPPPPILLASAAGMILIGIGLTGIAGAIGILGKLSIKTLIKGLLAIAGVMFVLAESLYLMAGTLPGAAALLVAAIALGVMVPVIAALGNMKWSTIFKGLVAVAMALSTLAIFGLLAAPAMLGIGIALIPLGLGMLLVAAAAKKMAEAFVLLSTTGEKGITAAVAAITALIYLLPKLIIDFIKGLLSIVEMATKLLPKIIQALGLAILSMLDAVIQIMPKLMVAIGKILDGILEFMRTYWPKLIEAGAQFILNLLVGLDQHADEMTNRGVDILLKFLDTIDRRLPEIQDKGAELMVTWLNGMKEHIPEMAKAASEVMATFITEIGKHEERMIDAASTVVGAFLGAVVTFYPKAVETAVEVIGKFIEGLGNKGPALIKKGVDAAEKFLNGLADGLVGLAEIGMKAMTDFLNGLAEAIRSNDDELRDAGWNLADAMLSGLQDGLDDIGWKIVAKLGKLIKLLPKSAKKLLKIASPSKVFKEIGGNISLGLAEGIEDEKWAVIMQSEELSMDTLRTFKEAFKIRSPSEVMRDIGKFVGEGFAEGLKGSEDDVNEAFKSMTEKLTDSMNTAIDTIKSEQDKLDELMAEKKKDWKAIAESRKVIKDNEKLLRDSLAARRALTGQLKDEHDALLQNAKDLDGVVKALEKAQSDLEQLKKDREEFAKSTSERYGELPEVTEETTLADYKKSIAERIIAVRKYGETLQKLREQGLDDATYKKLLDMGTSGQQFADQLLKGGKAAIDGLRALDTTLAAESAKIGLQAADNLYNKGIEIAQKLVDGLLKDKAKFEAVGISLADEIIKGIKKKLKIQSPSKVFVEIGKQTVDGFIKGFGGGTAGAAAAAAGVGDAIVGSLGQTMADLSTIVSDNMDIEPTITPVLDLTQVQKDAQKLSDLTNVVPITAATSYQHAAAISAEKSAADIEAAEAAPANTFTYEQTINSPDPISPIEVYRQTNNALGKLSRFFQMSAA